MYRVLLYGKVLGFPIGQLLHTRTNGLLSFSLSTNYFSIQIYKLFILGKA